MKFFQPLLLGVTLAATARALAVNTTQIADEKAEWLAPTHNWLNTTENSNGLIASLVKRQHDSPEKQYTKLTAA